MLNKGGEQFVELTLWYRLGELVIPSLGAFEKERHASRRVQVGYRALSDGSRYACFHIP